MTPIGPEERLFSLGDLVRLYQREKRRMFYAALLGACLLGGFALTRPLTYSILATFKEGVEKKEGIGSVQEMLFSINAGQEMSQAAILMKSNQVLKPLIRSLGLQAGICETRRSFFQNAFDHLRAELFFPLSDLDPFVFRDVCYEGEKSIDLHLRFLDRTQFEIDGQIGRIHEPCTVANASFCIEKIPKELNLSHAYTLRLDPWISCAEQIRNSLKIVNHKMNKAILNLTFFHRDRVRGAELLNELMDRYRSYLKSEHDLMAEDQLAYLEKRQDQLFSGLDDALQEYVQHLKENADQKGFASSQQETSAFLASYKTLFSRSFAIELELEKLAAGIVDRKEVLPKYQEIQELASERDLLASTLLFQGQRQSQDPAVSMQMLQQVRSELADASQALRELEVNPQEIVLGWASQFSEKEDLAHHLRKLVRLYSVREKILRERQFQSDHETLEGIDLITAKGLLVEANRRFDQIKASLSSHQHLLEKVVDPSFELTSLGNVLQDPMSQRFLAEAYRLHVQIKDQDLYSEKEEGRLGRELAQQRKVLADHIQQMIDVSLLELSLCEEKISSLQQIRLDCIEQQLSAKQQQIDEFVSERKRILLHEKGLVMKKMEQLRSQMAAIPGQKRAEQLLKLKAEMSLRTMQSVTQLVESKTIGHHLHRIESRPLDLALIPLKPKRGFIALLILAGAFLGALGAFSWAFLQGIHRGFPAALDTLRAMRYPTAGQISFHTDGPEVKDLLDEDLETLRNSIALIDRSKVVGILAGKGPNFSYELARLLAREGRKVLLIRCDFQAKFSDRDLPGLLQGFGQIRKERDFDLLPSGGTTRYGTELIRSENFAALLERYKQEYDHILLYDSSALDSAQVLALLARCDKAIATLTREPIELLTPLAQWAYYQQRCRLTFLTVLSS